MEISTEKVLLCPHCAGSQYIISLFISNIQLIQIGYIDVNIFVYISFIERVLFLFLYIQDYMSYVNKVCFTYTLRLPTNLSAPTAAIKETGIPLKGAVTRATVETADPSWYPLPLARKVRSEGSPLFKGPHRFRMIWDATSLEAAIRTRNL